MSRHTEGDWELTEDDNQFEIRMGTALGGSGGYEPQHLVEYAGCLDPEDQPEQYAEALANARLMAASPDLLAACIAAQNWGSQGSDDEGFSVDDEGFSVSEMLRAAIAKATGATP